MCQLTPIRVLVEDKLVMYLQSYLKSAELLYQQPSDSILSRYFGADTICIPFFYLRIFILQVLRFDIAMRCN